MADTRETRVRDFVLAGHGNLAAVQSMLAEDPSLLNARFEANDESALDAASHVGNRAIVEFLLERGATMTIHAAAMLGRKNAVIAMLRRDPSLAGRPGVHGMSALFHAAIGGHTQIADAIYACSPNADMDQVLHAAVASGSAEMTSWVLAQGPRLDTPRFDGKTPLRVAIKAANASVATLLRSAGAPEPA